MSTLLRCLAKDRVDAASFDRRFSPRVVALVRRARADQGAFGLGITPDDAQLYVTSPETGTLSILDASTGPVIASLHVGAVPRRVAFDATGKTAVVTNEGNWVDIVR